MDFKPKNREWVKNAAIVFLAVLLVLTFFSNTWMNRSLPEVATQSVTDGAITAKVRGTGTVTANGTHQVKADQTREIRAVMVKAGQEVSAGDVLFILGEGDSAEIEAAEEALRALQISYQKAAVGPVYSYKVQELEIESAEQAWYEAERALQDVQNTAPRDLPNAQKAAAQAEVEAAQAAVEAAKKAVAEQEMTVALYQAVYDEAYANAQAEVDAAVKDLGDAQKAVDEADSVLRDLARDLELAEDEKAALEQRKQNETEETPEDERVSQEEIEAAEAKIALIKEEITTATLTKQAADNAVGNKTKAVEDKEKDRNNTPKGDLLEQQNKLEEAQNAVTAAEAELNSAQDKLAAIEAVIDEIVINSSSSEEYKKAKDARDAAKLHYETLVYNLEQQKASDARSQALAGIDLADLSGQIERAREKLADLSGGEENQITANVSGTVQTVDCTAGDTKVKGDVLCSIEVPDMGHTLSFSVTNEQARRLRPGDVGSVSNFYWGNQITATLTTIQVDPKNPQTNKMLTFDLDGDVNTGSELTISVGQKSANYDTIIPNSAIRSDSNGSFVLAVEARNSPLGNRYVARRVNVEVLASDDVNSAVTADLGYGDYVITTSNAPVKNGDLVRLADS
ncbi:MAG: hypothetical protein IJ179_01010 [Oscillospiraceae bacterium]|nr:hypothetical protein [Oscillospiraceae bacterium]